MTEIDRLLEDARQARYDDGWYVEEHPYALELRCPSHFEFADGSKTFVFPVGPQEVTVSRSFRKKLTATLGGIVTEERGLYKKDITVRGSFGLEPKIGYDTTFDPMGPVGAWETKLSGPMWTMRLIRNVLEKYAELKSDPQFAGDALLIWHDFKTDEHYIVVPGRVDIPRSVQTRMQFPFMLQMEAVGDADSIFLPEPKSSFLQVVSQVIGTIRMGAAIVQAAMLEGSEVLGEVRYVAAEIDSILDDVTAIVTAANDVVDGAVRTHALGQTFISSTATAMEAVLELLEDADDVPHDIYAQYASVVAGLDMIAAQVSAFEESWEDRTEEFGTSEMGVAGTSDATKTSVAAQGPATTLAALGDRAASVSDAELGSAGAVPESRLFHAFPGLMDYQVQAGDTLQQLAARYIGDGAYWYEIATANNLSPPYIGMTGAPGTVRPGDKIAIPVFFPSTTTAVVSATAGTTEDQTYGTDIRLRETTGSRPGRPMVDVMLDRRTMKDVAVISGLGNLEQAIQMRIWTRRGTIPGAPLYGLVEGVGWPSTTTKITAMKVSLREAMYQDPRVKRVRNLIPTVDGDVVEFDAQVVPIGSTTWRTLAVSLR